MQRCESRTGPLDQRLGHDRLNVLIEVDARNLVRLVRIKTEHADVRRLAGKDDVGGRIAIAECRHREAGQQDVA